VTASLDPAASAAAQALRALQSALEASRAQWDDPVRRTFDQRFADRIVTDGRRTVGELTTLAQELRSATSTIAGLA
jgi:hypothetical protein